MSSRPLVALDSVCETRTGTRDPGKAPGQRFWYVDIASVDNRVKRINGAKQLLGEEAPSRARRIIRTGDVIVSMTRPNLNAVALVPESFDNQICSTGFGVLRPKASLLSEYLFYFVTNPAFVSIASGAVSGAMYPAITESFLRSITIPLPPLDEQRRIVDMLNHAASIRRLCAHAKAKAKELIPALFLDMFGDPATNPKGWEIATIGSVIEGAQYGTSKKAHENGHGLPVLRMGNVTYEGDLDLTDLKYVELDGSELAKVSLRNGDILFNRTNSKDLVGKTGLWDGRFDAVAASYFIRVRIQRDLLKPHYLWSFMNSSYMKRRLFETARGAIGQANINAKELRSFTLPRPPLRLQDAFAERITDIQATIDQMDRAAAAAEQLQAALMARLFTGG